MREFPLRMLVLLSIGVIAIVCRWGATGYAGDLLKIDGLSNDPKQFRVQVEQLITKTDALITKLRANPNHQAVILDLLQTRDDILRELPKIDSSPGDAKWTSKEMYESVQSKLKLLKDQYDKASAL